MDILPIVILPFVLTLLGPILLIAISYKKVSQGQAIVRNGLGQSRVSCGGAMMVYPFIHKHELIDLTTKRISASVNSYDQEGAPVKVSAKFDVRINNNELDILRASTAHSCEKTFNFEYVNNHFTPVFEQSVKSMIKNSTLSTKMSTKQEEDFLYKLYEYIGNDLNGYILDQIIIEEISVSREKSIINS